MHANVSLNFFVLVNWGIRMENIGRKLPISDKIVCVWRKLLHVGANAS